LVHCHSWLYFYLYFLGA